MRQFVKSNWRTTGATGAEQSRPEPACTSAPVHQSLFIGLVQLVQSRRAIREGSDAPIQGRELEQNWSNARGKDRLQ